MMNKFTAVCALMACQVLGVQLGAQAQNDSEEGASDGASQARIRTISDATVAWNECVQGAARGCIARDEDHKQRIEDLAGPCGSWKTVELQVRVAADAYVGEDPGRRANTFTEDMSKILYGEGLPKSSGAGVTKFGSLYSDPNRGEWTEVSTDGDLENTIVVWPNFGGVVVADTRPEKSKGLRDSSFLKHIHVAYPSDNRGGLLRILNAEALGQSSAPKFIAPASAVRE